MNQLFFNCLLDAGSEVSYKEGSMESQSFGPRCFRDLLTLTVEAICQMYPPLVAARVAWEWAWLTGVNNWSKLTGILPQCNLCKSSFTIRVCRIFQMNVCHAK